MAKPPKGITAFSFQRELVACGKGTCSRCGGTKFVHGPYWYAYWTKPKGGTGKVYVGKQLSQWCSTYGVTSHKQAAKTPKTAVAQKTPAAPQAKATPTPKKENPDHARMLSGAATPLLAAKLLGVKPGISRGILTCAFRDKMKSAHPDKGGNNTHAAALNAAFAMLKKLVK